jgi:hypothetical protein
VEQFFIGVYLRPLSPRKLTKKILIVTWLIWFVDHPMICFFTLEGEEDF